MSFAIFRWFSPLAALSLFGFQHDDGALLRSTAVRKLELFVVALIVGSKGCLKWVSHEVLVVLGAGERHSGLLF